MPDLGYDRLVKITKDEFRKDLDDFFAWAASGPRSRVSWLLSLEDWARMSINDERAREQKT